MSLRAGLALAVVLSGLAAGDGVSQMPGDSTLSSAGGLLHVGTAAAFKADVFGGNPELGHVSSTNPAVLQVASSTDGIHSVVWAEATGSADLVIRQDGVVLLVVPVTVVDP
jgi:hypothetical protein